MDAEEFAGWREYWVQNPEHEERADRRNGILCHLLSILKQNKIPKAHEPIDFMPHSKKEERPQQTVEQAIAMMNMFCTAHNKAKG